MNSADKRKVKADYDGLGGELYDLRYREEQERKYEVAFLLMKPTGEELTLDDGCGTGMLLSRLESTTVGIDVSSSLLNAAKSRLQVNHHLIVGDAEHLPLRDEMFNVVYAMTLIQNVPNKHRVVSEMVRVTRHQGVILVTALKAIFAEDFLSNLLEGYCLANITEMGDAGTNDWIAYSEKL